MTMGETNAVSRAAPPPAPPSSNGYATLDQLRTVAPMAERDLDLPGGVRVRIRQLSRHAQHQINREAGVGTATQDLEKAEQLSWVYGLIHPTVAGAEDAAALFASLEPSVAQTITDAILELSGLTVEAQATSAAAFQPAHAG